VGTGRSNANGDQSPPLGILPSNERMAYPPSRASLKGLSSKFAASRSRVFSVPGASVGSTARSFGG